MKIDAVVFDLDGLMIDSERVVQKTWDIAGEWIGYGALGHHIYQTLGFNLTKRKTYFEECYGKEFPFDLFRKETKKAWNAYVACHEIPAKKGLYHLLNVLKQQEIKLGVATSSSRAYAVSELENKKILSYFDALVFGDMVKEAKPSPEIYEKACELLQVNPQKAIALEDSLHGIKAAHAAGMMSIFVPDLVSDATSIDGIVTAKLKDLDEVAEWLLHELY